MNTIKVLIILAVTFTGSAFSMDKAPDPRPQQQNTQIRDGFTGGIQAGNPSGIMAAQGEMNIGGTSGNFSGSAGVFGNSWGGQSFNFMGSMNFREMVREIILEELGVNQ